MVSSPVESNCVNISEATTTTTAFDWSCYENRDVSLKKLRSDRVHLDTILESFDGQRQAVHWQVISALCPKLIDLSKNVSNLINDDDRRHFSNDLTDGTTRKCNTKIKYKLLLPRDINGSQLVALIDCAYSGLIQLDNFSLTSIYEISIKYNIMEIIDACCTYMLQRLNVYNCVKLFLLAKKHNHPLQYAAWNMIRYNFKLVLFVNQDIHLIPLSYYESLLMDDHLKIEDDEEFVWTAIVRWFQLQPLTHQEYIMLFVNQDHDQDETNNNSDNSIVSYSTTLAKSASTTDMRRTNKSLALSSADNNRTHYENLSKAPMSQFPFSSISNQLINGNRENETNNETSSELIQQQATIGHRRQIVQCDDATINSDTEHVQMEKIHVSINNEASLIRLLNCLRYDKFHSRETFDCILGHRLIRSSCNATKLVHIMRQNYIMMANSNSIDETSGVLATRSSNNNTIDNNEPLQIEHINDQRIDANNSGSHLVERLVSSLGTILSRIRRRGRVAQLEANRRYQTKSHNGLVSAKSTGFIINHVVSRPRIPSSVAFLIGGWQHGMASKSIWSYDFIHDRWFKLKLRLPEARAYHSSELIGNLIYIIGGTNGRQYLDSVICFDPLDTSKTKKSYCANGDSEMKRRNSGGGDRFISRKSMSEKRCYLSTVVHSNNRLYALGGHNGQQRLRTAECYNIETDSWSYIADMTIARSNASACLHDDKIFIAGGQITDQFIQSSVEFYKPQDDTWTFVTPMHVPRMSFALVSYKSYLMAIGGCNGLGFTKTVERYNSLHSNWSLCSSMLHKRSSFAPIIIDDKLMVVGGYNGFVTMKNCEYFNVLKALQLRQGPVKWTKKSNLLHNRSGFSVCVIRVLSNAHHYTYNGYSSGESNLLD